LITNNNKNIAVIKIFILASISMKKLLLTADTRRQRSGRPVRFFTAGPMGKKQSIF
jgi:hypothetical protein